MAKWLLKTEPSDYSFGDLVREEQTVWDGVTNNWALKFIKEISAGDEVLIYHTGKEKCVAGVARVISDIYPDPGKTDEKLLVFDVEPVRPLSGKVTLKKLKDDKFFAEFLLIKFTRLSVMPVEKKYWSKIIKIDTEYGNST